MTIPALPAVPLTFVDKPITLTPLSAAVLNPWGTQITAIAEAARTYALDAQSSASAASAPTDSVVASALTTPGTATRTAADELYAAPSGVDSARYMTPDDATDQSTEFQAALDAAAAALTFGAGTVLLRPGTYLIGTACTAAPGVTVRGMTGAILAAVGNNRILNVGSDCTVAGVTFLGTNPVGGTATLTSQTAVAATGTALAHVTNVTIEGCTFTGLQYAAVQLTWVEGFRVADNTLTDYGYDGVLCSRVWDGHVTGNRLHGTGVLPSYSVNSYGVSVSLGSGESELPARVIIANNIVTNQAWEALDTHGGEDIVFANNVIVGCEMGIAVTELSSTTLTGPRNVTVTGNVIDAASYPSAAVRAGISINGSDDLSRNAVVNVTGNVVVGHGVAVANTSRYDETAGSVTIRFSDSVVVSGNLIRSGRNAGVVFRFGGTVTVTGNVFETIWRETSGTTGESTAVYLDDHVTAMVTGNAFSTGDAGFTNVNERGVYVAGGTGVVHETANSWPYMDQWVTSTRETVAGFTNLSSFQIRGGMATVMVYLTAVGATAAGNKGAAITAPFVDCPTDIWFTGTSSTGATWRGRVITGTSGSVTVNTAPALADGQFLYGAVTYPVSGL